jgi:hypothetical protein
MTITTTNGYVVTFKSEDQLTVRDRQRLRKAFMSHADINLKTGKMPDSISGGAIIDVQEESLRVLLVSIQRPDGSIVTENLLDEVYNWKTQVDADQIFEAVQKVTTPELSQAEKNS